MLRAELPLVYTILRYLPLRNAQKIVTADDVVYDHGAIAIHNMRSGQGNNMNLFGQMLAASDDYEKAALPDKAVREEAGNLIVAGSDTTAVTLTYLVWAVLKDPTLQARLEEEIAGLSDQLDMTELESSPLLNSVIEETLRLYGAAPGALPRVVPSQGMIVAGYQLPAGTEVSTQAYTLHRDSRIFQEPLRWVHLDLNLRDFLANTTSQLRWLPLSGQVEHDGSAESCLHAVRRGFTCLSGYPPRLHGTPVGNSTILQAVPWREAESLHAGRNDGDG